MHNFESWLKCYAVTIVAWFRNENMMRKLIEQLQ